jgi:hypothetical protein
VTDESRVASGPKDVPHQANSRNSGDPRDVQKAFDELVTEN